MDEYYKYMIALSKFLKENPQHDPFDLPLFPPVLVKTFKKKNF
jgi:hypothetical protein